MKNMIFVVITKYLGRFLNTRTLIIKYSAKSIIKKTNKKKTENLSRIFEILFRLPWPSNPSGCPDSRRAWDQVHEAAAPQDLGRIEWIVQRRSFRSTRPPMPKRLQTCCARLEDIPKNKFDDAISKKSCLKIIRNMSRKRCSNSKNDQ